ncbi:hypothetical protein J132_04247 [Termitomyces sp. J132]|nr:hypothetical protein J132_04247 [Termitomyces sp. J132]
MASKDINLPDIINLPRFTTLLVSLLVALGSGTNYVYSAYAPQLGARLNISHTHLNIVGLAGNLGVYTTGPIWGRMVDTHGPRMPMASAFVLLLVGYTGIKFIFDAGVPTNANANSSTNTISFFTSCVLVLCGFMTGAGGNSGFTGAVNSTAKTVPDKMATTGIVISGFGLSAFLFSTVSRIYFPDNTSSFLGLLALGTSLPMIAGFFFVRPISLPTTPGRSSLEEARGSREDRDEEVDDEHSGEQSTLLPLSFPSLRTPSPSPSPSSQLRPPSLPRHPTNTLINIHPPKLFKSIDFWLLFSILSTHINNVGLMSQALYIHSLQGGGGGATYDPTKAARYQANQVSLISLFNFAGRIFIGLLTDTLYHTHGLPRSTSLILVSTLFLLSQLLAAFLISDVAHLYITKWFGITHFSENWGYLAIAPVICGNIFAVVFGRNLDAHDNGPSLSFSPSSSPPPSPPPLPPSSRDPLKTSATIALPSSTCTLGRKCYVDAIYLTLFACFVALGLSVWAGWRDRQRMGLRREGGRWG